MNTILYSFILCVFRIKCKQYVLQTHSILYTAAGAKAGGSIIGVGLVGVLVAGLVAYVVYKKCKKQNVRGSE